MSKPEELNPFDQPNVSDDTVTPVEPNPSLAGPWDDAPPIKDPPAPIRVPEDAPTWDVPRYVKRDAYRKANQSQFGGFSFVDENGKKQRGYFHPGTDVAAMQADIEARGGEIIWADEVDANQEAPPNPFDTGSTNPFDVAQEKQGREEAAIAALFDVADSDLDRRSKVRFIATSTNSDPTMVDERFEEFTAALAKSGRDPKVFAQRFGHLKTLLFDHPEEAGTFLQDEDTGTLANTIEFLLGGKFANEWGPLGFFAAQWELDSDAFLAQVQDVERKEKAGEVPPRSKERFIQAAQLANAAKRGKLAWSSLEKDKFDPDLVAAQDAKVKAEVKKQMVRKSSIADFSNWNPAKFFGTTTDQPLGPDSEPNVETYDDGMGGQVEVQRGFYTPGTWATAWRAAMQGHKQAEVGMGLLKAALDGGDTWELEKQLIKVKQEGAIRPVFGDDALSTLVSDTAQLAASQYRTFAGAAAGGALAKGAVAVAKKVVPGGWATALIPPKLVKHAWKIGGFGGGWAATFNLEAGGAMVEYMDLKTDDGKKIDPVLAAGMAIVEGTISSTIEVATDLGPVLGVFGPLGEAVKAGTFRQLQKDLLLRAKDKTYAQMLRDVAKKAAKGAHAEGMEEVYQAATKDVIGYLGRVHTAGDTLQSADFLGSALEATEGYRAAVTGMGVVGVAGATVNFHSQKMARQASEREIELAQAIARGGVAPTAQQNPSFWEQLIGEHTAKWGDRVQSFHLDPVDGFLVLFQDEGLARQRVVTPEAEAAAVRILGEGGDVALKEAVTTGKKLEVPLSAFAGQIAGTPMADAIRLHITTKPFGQTAYQLMQVDEEADQRVQLALQELDEQPEKMAPEEQGFVQLAKDLRKLGKMTADEAQENVRTWRAFFRTQAARSNMTGKERKEFAENMVVRVRESAQASAMREDNDVIRAASSGSKQANETIAKGIYADNHTPLANAKAWEEYQKRERKGVFVFVDLNRLKKINDELGHGIGNFAITTVGELLSTQSLRQAGRGFRVGGDEYVFHFQNRQAAQMFIMGTQDEAGKLPALSNGMRLSMSIGAGGSVKLADEAMYKAKERSKPKALDDAQKRFLSKSKAEQTQLLESLMERMADAQERGGQWESFQRDIDAYLEAQASERPEEATYQEWNDEGIEELTGPLTLSQDPLEVAHTYWGTVITRASDTMTRLVADQGEEATSDPAYQEARAQFERAVEARSALAESPNFQPALNGRPIWSGVVSLLDGEIEASFSYEQAKAEDFHHSLLISPTHKDGLREGTHSYFWIEKDGAIETVDTAIPPKIRQRMREQINWLGTDLLEQRLKYVPGTAGKGAVAASWAKVEQALRAGGGAQVRGELAKARKKKRKTEVRASESTTLEQYAREYAKELPASARPKTEVEWADFIETFGDSLGLTFAKAWSEYDVLEQNDSPAAMDGGTAKYAVSSLDELGPKERIIVWRQLDKLPNAAQVFRSLRRFAGTSWARQAIQAALFRQAVEDMLAGKVPEHESVLNAPRSAKIKKFLSVNGKEGIFLWLGQAKLIGEPEKPGLAVNGSFLNCNPSEACAKYCYATNGNYAYPESIARSEMLQMAIEADPNRAAKMITAQYKGMAESKKKALRFFDKGDLGPAFLPVFEEMHREGVRAAIFSKQGALLSQVNPFHLRLLSVDATNREAALEHPDLPWAYVYNGTEEDAAWINAHKKHITVVLPVIVGHKFLTRAQIKLLDKELQPHVCPVDKGMVSLHQVIHVLDAKNNVVQTYSMMDDGRPKDADVQEKLKKKADALAKKIGGRVGVPANQNWRCGDCDVKGGIGCYYGATTEEALALSGPVTASEWVATIHEINSLARDPKLRAGLLEELRSLVREAQEGSLRGREGEAVRATRPDSLDARGGVRPGYFNILEQNDRPARFDAAGFYSQAERTVLASKDERAKGPRWLALLERSIKAEELEWIFGLREYLKANDKKAISREEVAAYIREHRVQVVVRPSGKAQKENEVRLREAKAALDAAGGTVLEENGPEDALVLRVPIPDGFGGAPWSIDGDKWQIQDQLTQNARANDRQLTNAEAKLLGIVEEYHDAYFSAVQGIGDDYQHYTIENEGAPPAEPDSYETWGLYLPGVSDTVIAGHFPDNFSKGLVGWARVSVHRLPTGEKMLFIEEIQSDVHQDARSRAEQAQKWIDSLRTRLAEQQREPTALEARGIALNQAIVDAGGYKTRTPGEEERRQKNIDAAKAEIQAWLDGSRPTEIRSTQGDQGQDKWWAVDNTGEWFNRNTSPNANRVLARISAQNPGLNPIEWSIEHASEKIVEKDEDLSPSDFLKRLYEALIDRGYLWGNDEWWAIEEYALAEQFNSREDAEVYAASNPDRFVPSHVDQLAEADLKRLDAPDTVVAAYKELSRYEGDAAADGEENLPYKGRAFQDLMQRYILRQAAVLGFDHVGWTTGLTQAKRYSVTTVADTIEYEPRTKAFAAKRGNRVVQAVIPVEPGDLYKYIGPAVAEELLKSPTRDRFDGTVIHEMRAHQIQVIEEASTGHPYWYDQIMTSYFEKLTKKDGGFAERVQLVKDGRPLGPNESMINYERARGRMTHYLWMWIHKDNADNAGSGKPFDERFGPESEHGKVKELIRLIENARSNEDIIAAILGHPRTPDGDYSPFHPVEVRLALADFKERFGMDPKEVLKPQPGFEVWHLEIPKATQENLRNEGVSLFQDDQGTGPNGWTQFIKDGVKRIYEIALSPKSNASTFMHESAHVFMDILAELAERPNAPAAVREDFAKILRFVGVADRAELLHRMHNIARVRQDAAKQGRALNDWEVDFIQKLASPFEKWARAFEVYLWEGNSPSEYLQSTFVAFKLWMGNVYKSVADLGVDLNPEIRGVMDRMLATDEEINGTISAMGFQSLFRSPEEAGMTPEEWKGHLAIMRQAVSHARLAAQHATAKRIQAVTEKWWKQEVEKQIEALLLQYQKQPAAQLLKALKKGEATGNAILDTLLAEAKKKALQKMDARGMPAEAKKRIGELDARIREIEGRRATEAAQAVSDGTSAGKAGVEFATRNPLGPLSVVVDRPVVVIPEVGMVDFDPAFPPKDGEKLISIQMPAWLDLDGYLKDQEAWNWVWTAGGTTAPRLAQEILLHYAKQALAGDTFGGQRFEFNYLKLYRLAAIMGLNDQRGVSRRGAMARTELAAWAQQSPATRAENPVPDKAWTALIKGGDDLAAKKWYQRALAFFDGYEFTFEGQTSRKVQPFPWVNDLKSEDAAKPRFAYDPTLAADMAKVEELRKERAGIVDEFTSAQLGKARGRLKLAYGQVSVLMGKKGLTFFRGLLAMDGLDINDLASALQFPDAKSMIEAVMTLPDPKKWARQEAERLVAEAHPEVAVDREKLKDVISKGVAGDATLVWFLHELDVLRVKLGADEARRLEAMGAGSAGVALDSIRRSAEGLVGKKNIGKLDVGGALAASERSGDKAIEAAAKQDFALAYVHRHEQILNLLVYRALVDAKDDREQLLNLAKNLNSQRARWGKVNPIYRDGIDQILEIFELANVPKATKQRAPLYKLLGYWVDDPTVPEGKVWTRGLLEDDGATVLFDTAALQDLIEAPPAGLGKNGEVWTGLTVDQARLLRDALMNIYGAMIERDMVMRGDRKERLEEARNDLIEEWGRNLPSKGNVSSSPEAQAVLSRLWDGMQHIDADLLKLETVFMWLGGRDLGSVTAQTFVLPMQRAKHREADLHKKIVLPIMEAMDNVPKEVRRRFREKVDGEALFPTHRAGIDAPTMRFELLVMALNRGNPGNLYKMCQGRNITVEEVDNALSLLTPEEMAWVQRVWDVMSLTIIEDGKNLWQMQSDLEERKSGLAPKEVEAEGFEINGIQYRGGYYPVAYDRRIAVPGEKQAADSVYSLFDPHFTRAFTRHDHLKARNDKFADVVSLSPAFVQAHLSKVVHDLAFREVVQSVGTLLFDPALQTALKEYLGNPRFTQLITWLRDVGSMRGAEVVVRARGINGVFRRLRKNMGFGILGYAIDIPLGDTSNLAVYSTLHPQRAKHLTGAVADLLGDREKWVTFAQEKSGELRFRRHQIKEKWGMSMREFTRRRVPVASDAYYLFIDHSFDFFELIDRLTATPIWLSSYRAEMAEHGDEQRAIEQADADVRQIFPSHHAVDASEIMRDRGFVGSAMLFFGYLNTIYNVRRDISHDLYLALHGNELLTKEPNVKDAMAGLGKAAFSLNPAHPGVTWRLLGLVVAYQILGEWLSGRGAEEDEEPWEWWLRKILMGMTVNDIPFGAAAEPIATLLLTGEARRSSVRAAPGIAVIDGLARTATAAAKGDVDAQKAAYDVGKALGLAFGIPYRPMRAASYVLDLAQGTTEARPPYFFDVASGVGWGEHRNQSSNPMLNAQDLVERMRK